MEQIHFAYKQQGFRHASYLHDLKNDLDTLGDSSFLQSTRYVSNGNVLLQLNIKNWIKGLEVQDAPLFAR